jgi:hypothetical protein
VKADKAEWRSGSACDSSTEHPQGHPFKSGLGHLLLSPCCMGH